MLEDLIRHSFSLYGERNRVFLQSLNERIGYLNLSLCDFQDAVRKEKDSEVLGMALARIVSRIFCIAEYFWNIPTSENIPLVEALSQKYPAAYCSYCHSFPCQCQEKRPDPVLEKISKDQLNWSLRQWQNHLGRLYGGRNRRKGKENIINRLFKETGELLFLQMGVSAVNLDPYEVEWEFALELSDALAWTIAVANFFEEVDLEREFLKRYGQGCLKCGQNPCCCKNFRFMPMKW